MEAKEDFDYAAEYAKSNRSQCKGCKSLIAKDSLRIALMVQSPFFDGKQPNWYHYSCFFGKCRPTNTGQIKDFGNLRFPDQEKIQAQIDNFAGGSGAKGKKGPKVISKTLKDFVVQYAPSNRSTCRGCDKKIDKEEIRLSHKEKHPEKPQLGLVDRWHHVGCFLKKKKDMGWEDHFTAEMLTGFSGLDAGDKTQIKTLLAPKEKRSKSKKKDENGNAVCSSVANPEEEKIKKEIKIQSIKMWKNIDKIKKYELTKPDLASILEYNEQNVPKGVDAMYLAIGDGMTFGALPKCTVCMDGNLVVASNEYQCTGQISEWTGCTFTTTEIKRLPWKFPSEIMGEFAEKFKFVKQNRVFPPRPPPLPLKNKKVMIIGKVSGNKADMKASIEKLGGGLTTSLSKAYFCISTKKEVEEMGKKMSDAQIQDLFIVADDILQALEQQKQKEPMLPLLKKHSLAEWGSEQQSRAGGKRALEEENTGEGDSKKMKMVVKSGAAVDPESEMDSCAHVYVKGDMKYTATLSMVDMKHGSNSYYKLQLLEHDRGGRYYVFRSWGRVGTTIGGTKLDDFYSLTNAISNFLEVYSEKTGNNFGSKNFVKYPRKFFPIEIDYGEDDEKLRNLQDAGSKSKLQQEVQKLIKMIFDVESMKRAMVEFEIDLSKMPLGKLSKRQLQMAYTVLTEANELIDKGELTSPKILDCSNRFYTLIPHNFGMKQPPLLDNLDLIKSKVEMIDNLLDIEVAYNLLQEVKEEPGIKKEKEEEVDPLDVHYKKLQCKIEPIPKDHDIHAMVEKVVKNTHAKTHSWYDLEVEQVFNIERKGEHSRYRPFKNLHNRRLLWHGSRVTNYAGILSQGLRIAPPEAPMTGYMFGKGIYFADMVSKSANYCHATNENPIGIAMLAEVALGNMHELKNAKDVRKLPKGKHSVKGVGSTSPDTEADIILEDGTIVHAGEGVDSNVDRTSLLYNEYIVYDVAQVNLKYLVKMKFNMQSRW